MKHIVKITVIATLLGSAASAGSYEPPIVEPPLDVASAHDWSGSYVGLSAGSDTGSMVYTPGFSFTLTQAASFALFGGHNWQNGNLVYGAEVSIGKSGTYPGAFSTEEFTYLADLKGRVGYAADKVMFYGFAGPSIGQYSIPVLPAQWNVNGYNYGVGVDVAVTEKVFVGLEYMTRELSGATSTPGQVQDTTIRTVQARIGWAF